MGTRAAALTLTAAAATGLGATPAQAAGSYHIIATIGVGGLPDAVAVSPDGSQAYVANSNSNSVSVIDTATDQVIATIHGFCRPDAIAVRPGGSPSYVISYMALGTVSVVSGQ